MRFKFWVHPHRTFRVNMTKNCNFPGFHLLLEARAQLVGVVLEQVQPVPTDVDIGGVIPLGGLPQVLTLICGHWKVPQVQPGQDLGQHVNVGPCASSGTWRPRLSSWLKLKLLYWPTCPLGFIEGSGDPRKMQG